MFKRIIRKCGLQGVDWIHTAQDIQVTGSCEDDNEPPGIYCPADRTITSKVGGFKPGRAEGFLKAKKSAAHFPSDGK
jgi:hypothetical protein